MSEFDKLKDIWKQQGKPGEVPDVSEMRRKIDKYNRKYIRESLILIISMAITFCIIVSVSLYYTFQYITTYIGIILILLSILTGLFLGIYMKYIHNKSVNFTADTKSYMKQTIDFIHLRKKKRSILSNSTAIFLLAGFAFYLFEFAALNLMRGIIAYVLTYAWAAFAIFFLGRRKEKKFKKEQEEIKGFDAIISSLEK